MCVAGTVPGETAKRVVEEPVAAFLANPLEQNQCDDVREAGGSSSRHGRVKCKEGRVSYL